MPKINLDFDEKKDILVEKINQLVEQDKEKIVQFFSKLTQCNTETIPGDTRSAVKLIQNFMDSEGLNYKELQVNSIMPNLISTIDTGKAGRHLMLNGHLDVLPAGSESGWTDSPWSGKITDGKVWGRGTADMKAGVTAMLFAYAYLAKMQQEFSGKLSLTLVSDEETGYERGTGFLFEQIEKDMLADCVLAAEPSGIDSISYASKGYMQFTVHVQTRGAIAGYSHESRNAIEIAASIMQNLKKIEDIKVTLPEILSNILIDQNERAKYEARRGKNEANFLDKITVDITTIQGGDMFAVIAPKCTFTVAIVLPVGTDSYLVYHQVTKIIAAYPEAELFFDGISVADISVPNHEIISILQDTVTALRYEKPEPVPDIAISDCRHWRYRGIPAFWYGPDGSRCSAANEYVEIEELLHLVRSYTLTALQYLQQPKIANRKSKTSAISLSPCTEIVPEIKSIPAIYVAYLQGIVESYKSADIDATIRKLLDSLYINLTKAGILVGATAVVSMQYKNSNGKKQVDIIVAYPIDKTISAEYNFKVMELPTIPCAAVVVHRGSQSTTATWNKLRHFAVEKGYKDKGIYREYYIITYPNPPQQWATELQLPLEEKFVN